MIQYVYLGRVDYGAALRLQEELVAWRIAGRIGNVLLLLEHPPVLTLGRNASRGNILASDEALRARGVTLHEINRGGDVTYHGPGQLIGYPIFDLRSLRNGSGGRLGPVDFVRMMEEALIRLCGEFGVPAGRICGLTGAWVGLERADESGAVKPSLTQPACKALPPAGRERKIAAIGIHVARGVTSHGFAFNVTTDLDDFKLINPCGITDRPVTSLAMEVAGDAADEADMPMLEAMAERAARQFGAVFGEPVEKLANVEELLALAEPAAAAESVAPAFPAEDTPLEIPAEIERLRRMPHALKDRPVSA